MPFVARYTDEQLLAELRRVAAEVDGPVTKTVFEERSEVSSATVRRRFGGWVPALAAAGLQGRSAHRAVSQKMKRRRPRFTGEELIEGLQAVADLLETDTLTQAQVRDHSSNIGTHVLVSRFGSFPAALKAAGLRTSKMANRWTDRQLAVNFRRVAKAVGRVPIQSDIDRAPSKISSRTYTYRHGSWAAAVEIYAR